ncbi:cadherin-like beta sandwich domain-containing protein [Paenibacillus sp. P25]|nr:cadherin-like beta sandwich domain-containing protein [Paenibacillus sp. P25]
MRAAPIPDGTEYVPGSLQIVSGPGAKQLTDTASDDNGEFDSANKRLVVRLGDGATPSAGGRLANTDDLPDGTTFRYQVRLTTANSVTNKPTVSYDNLLKDPVQHLTATPDPVLTASGTTQTSTTLSWDSVVGATYYDIYKDGVLIAPHVTGASYVVTGLTPATVYGFTVTAANDTKEISQSSLAVARTLSELKDLNVKDKSGNDVSLSPSFSPNTDSYQSTVAGDTDRISVTASVYHPSLAAVTMSVYDQDHRTVLSSVPLTSGQPSDLFPLSVGKNTIELTVTDIAGGTKTYTETVYRLPTVADIEKSGNAGDRVAFTKTDFTSKYPAGAPLTAVKIVTPPSTGTLMLGTVPVTIGQEIPADQLGNLTYVPAAGQTGEATFQWNGTSDGVNYADSPALVKITLANTAVTANLALSVNPAKIVGDGKSTSQLTAVLTDSSGKPIAGEDVVFSAPQGTFVGTGTATITAVTNAQGMAVVTYQSGKMTGTVPQDIPVTATVNDSGKNLKATGQVHVTFMPASISGILRNGNTSVPIAGASVRVKGPGLDQTVVTDVYGAYSVPVPLGDAEYTLTFTQPINIGGVDTPVTFTQKAKVDSSVTVGQNVPSVKTATGIVLSKQPNGKSALLDSSFAGKLRIYLKDAKGNYISENGAPKAFALQTNGVFLADGLSVGNYQMEVRYGLEAGKELTLVKDAKISVTADGELNILEELIDPYGTITDAVTGAAIEGAQVTLYYADTANNRNKGIVPGTQVSAAASCRLRPGQQCQSAT